MKLSLLFITLTLSPYIIGQEASFVSSDYIVKTRLNKYEWKINGQSVLPSNDLVKVKINYPRVDTIVFIKNMGFGANFDTVLTRFRPNKNYVFTISCCDDNYEVNYLTDYKKYQEAIETKPELYNDLKYSWISVGRLKVECNNIPLNDTLIVIPDLSAFGEAFILTNSSSLKYTYPSFGTDIHLKFSTYLCSSKEGHNFVCNGNNIETEDLLEFFQRLDVISRIQVRVFKDDKVKLKYNFETNNYSLEFN